jgi:ribonuclease D
VRPAIAELSEELGIPVENILTPDFLRALCFEPPELELKAVGAALKSLGARDWQIELTGQLIVDGFAAALVEPDASTDLA